MKREQFLLIALFVLLAAVIGCNGRLTQTDPTVPIKATAGETFKIVIEANPTTGYEWRLVGALDETVVQWEAKDYEPDQPINEGSGGMDVWTFQAVAAGESQIVLGYYPPDGSDVPDQTMTFTVIVE